MSYGSTSYRWLSAVLAAAGVAALSLVTVPLVGAAEPGPRPGPARGPKPPAGAHRAGAPKPGPRGPAPKHVPPGKVHHWHGTRYYWSPVYVPKASRYVWGATGYPYYIGGTSYTVIQEPASGLQTSAESGDPQGTSSVLYGQILELTAMVHEWRTLNESSEFQMRLPPDTADVPADSADVVKKIKQYNQRFDTVSRAGMQKIAAGQPADSELDQARTTLDSLIEVVDKLPAPPKRKQAGDTSSSRK